MNNQFFFNPMFRKYLSLLRNLHELIRNGIDETVEGEALRDSMDGPAASLTSEEIDCLNGISADFYSLAPDFHHTPAPKTAEVDSFIRESFDARNHNDYASSITLLRKAQRHLELWQLSYVRGSILLEAGEPLAASDFFLRAADLYPSNTNFRVMWLTALAKGNPAAAKNESSRILGSPSGFPPKLVYKAADIAFAATRELEPGLASRQTEELIPVFEETILRLKISGEGTEDPSVLAGAISLLGFCYEHIGEDQKAIKCFNEGLSMFPDNDALRVARGIHFYGTDNEKSVADFTEAVRLHSVLVWPYLFLAHQSLIKGEMQDCLKYSTEALRRSRIDQISADCLEWIAICMATLGHPRGVVLSTFNEALKLAPECERIKANMTSFEQSLATARVVAWKQVSSDALRDSGRHEFMRQAA
ncbi:MAG: hypothetical protein JNL58_25400 [Planctomyces sp.]|nr:hypothetical protein [Planctomyces sp.]